MQVGGGAACFVHVADLAAERDRSERPDALVAVRVGDLGQGHRDFQILPENLKIRKI